MVITIGSRVNNIYIIIVVKTLKIYLTRIPTTTLDDQWREKVEKL